MITLGARRVAEAVLRAPKVCEADATVAELQQLFCSDHVHAGLVVAEDGRLLAVVERDDLEGVDDRLAARSVGRLAGRVVETTADLESVWSQMRSGRRRVAVVDVDGRLVGLLCLKRSGTGFCTDDDVCSRRQEPFRR